MLAYFGAFSLHQMTALHFAAESNHIKMVECLLNQGADIDIQDDNEVILHTNVANDFELAGRYIVLNFHFNCCRK